MRLFTEVRGQSQPIVFLHGMASSGRYWQSVVKELPANYQTITIDLLGFGRSPMPKTSNYTYDQHISAVKDTLADLKIKEPIILVGHSMGALIALRMAANKSVKIKKLVLIGLPVFKDIHEARHEITHGRLALRLAYYGPTSYLLCTTWCKNLRPISKRVAPYYLKYLPKAVAEDSVLHTWHAYNQTRHHILEQQTVNDDLDKVALPVELIFGAQESPHYKNIKPEILKRGNIKLAKIIGSHHLPVEQPAVVASLIR